jgi:hypothetical protein
MSCEKCEAERAITKLFDRYCETTDVGDKDGHADLFAEGKWFFLPPGRDVYRSWLDDHLILYEDGTPKTKHHITNLIIDVADDLKTAKATATVQLFQGIPPEFPIQCITIARFIDEFENVDGRWVWRTHDIKPVLVGDTSRHLRRRKPAADAQLAPA